MSLVGNHLTIEEAKAFDPTQSEDVRLRLRDIGVIVSSLELSRQCPQFPYCHRIQHLEELIFCQMRNQEAAAMMRQSILKL